MIQEIKEYLIKNQWDISTISWISCSEKSSFDSKSESFTRKEWSSSERYWWSYDKYFNRISRLNEKQTETRWKSVYFRTWRCERSFCEESYWEHCKESLKSLQRRQRSLLKSEILWQILLDVILLKLFRDFWDLWQMSRYYKEVE